MCHRDFNSRNLALRQDLSCVVIDLGLAVCVRGAAHSRPGGKGGHGKPPALNEVGKEDTASPRHLMRWARGTRQAPALNEVDKGSTVSLLHLIRRVEGAR